MSWLLKCLSILVSLYRLELTRVATLKLPAACVGEPACSLCLMQLKAACSLIVVLSHFVILVEVEIRSVSLLVDKSSSPATSSSAVGTSLDGGHIQNLEVVVMMGTITSGSKCGGQDQEWQLNGCYSLVAEDRYDSIPLGQDGLVDRTVPGVISVQPGDVLGYFMTDSTRNDERREGIQLEEREDDDEERVWYNSRTLVTTGDPACPFPVGEGRILDTFTNSAPVIFVNIGKLP